VRTVKSPADLGSAMRDLLFRRRKSAAAKRATAIKPQVAGRTSKTGKKKTVLRAASKKVARRPARRARKPK
jgi:hypothetical protein